jgi:hypothetical protein
LSDALIGLFELTRTDVAILNLAFKVDDTALHLRDAEFVVAAHLLAFLIGGGTYSARDPLG